jgi:serine acetyltransferase
VESYIFLIPVFCIEFANKLWKNKFYFMAMLVSHISRFVVGIEAHSGVGDMKKSFY